MTTIHRQYLQVYEQYTIHFDHETLYPGTDDVLATKYEELYLEKYG